jgi:uncharacterized delta-60 repeat protein
VKGQRRHRKPRWSPGSLASLAFGLALLAPALAQAAKPGDLDRSFGGDGKVTTNFGHYNAASDAAIDPHGRIVAVGHPENNYFGLARYRRNGELDRTFSHNGKVATGAYGNPSSVAIDSQERIVVAGNSYNDFDDDYSSFVLARYRPDGTLDRSFGFGGRVVTDFAGYGNDTSAGSVAIDTHGRIVVAGVAGSSILPNWWDFALARYMPDGRLDPSFGGDGLVTTDFRGFGDEADAVAIDSQGRIVVAGYAQHERARGYHPDFALARYRSNGSLDPSFDGDGRVTTRLDRYSIAGSLVIDPQGRILAVGIAEPHLHEGDFGLARYLPNGELDPSFGSGGVVTTAFGRDHVDGAGSVAIDSHGRIVAVGGTRRRAFGSGGDFALARYWPSGSLDRSFSRNGKVTTTFGGDDGAGSVALDSEDRIVAAGGGGRKDDFALARYIGYRHRR